jgi:DNA-binding response OmpR family regulator
MSASYKLLLIDDEPDNLQALLLALEDYGFACLTATSGHKGLESARRDQPDLILLDIQMPGINGFVACEALKADPLTASIPVIFLTALAGAENKAKCFAAGAADYLAKPVYPQDLYARVTAHLNPGRLRPNLLHRLTTYQQRFGPLDQEPESHAKISQRHLRVVKEARALLLKNLRDPPCLEELARAVGSNPHRLSMDFQILYGMTAFGWLREQGLQQAANWLRDSDLSVEYIAQAIGYSGSSNFATAFKHRFGLSPRAYRKSTQKQP